LKETLAFFLPGLAKDLSAPLYNPPSHTAVTPSVPSGLQAVPLQGKAPKGIHVILREILAFFLPGQAKDLSAPLYNPPSDRAVKPSVPSGLQAVPLQGKTPKEIPAILTETLACFLPGQAKDLSAPLYNPPSHTAVTPSVPSDLQAVPLQGKAPKEIHTILTETLACFLPGQAKDLSAPLYNPPSHTAVTPSVPSGLQAVPLQGKTPKEIHAILTEKFICFFPGRAKDLSAPMYVAPTTCTYIPRV